MLNRLTFLLVGLLGVMALVSYVQEPNTAELAVGLALVASAAVALFVNRPYGWAACTAMMAGIVSFHATMALTKPDLPCSCLAAAGAPTHIVLLLTSSTLLFLLAIGRPAARGALDRRLAPVAMLLAVSLAAVLAMRQHEGLEPPPPPAPLSFDIEPPTLIGQPVRVADRPESETTPAPTEVPEPAGAPVAWTITVSSASPFDGGVAEVGVVDASGNARQLAGAMELPDGSDLVLQGESRSEAALPQQVVVAAFGRVGASAPVVWDGPAEGTRNGQADITFEDGEAVRVFIADPEGVPISGLRCIAWFDRTAPANFADPKIRIRGLASLGKKYAEFVTDAAGTFLVRGVPKSRWFLVAELDPAWKVLRHDEARALRVDFKTGSPPEGARAFVGAHMLVAIANLAHGDAPEGSDRPPGTQVSVVSGRNLPAGVWKAHLPFRWEYRHVIPGSAYLVANTWASQSAFTKLLGTVHSTVRASAPGYQDATGEAVFWTPGQDLPAPLVLTPHRLGEMKPLHLRIAADQVSHIPKDATLPLWITHEDAPTERSTAMFRVNDDSTMVSKRPLPAGRYRLSNPAWLAQDVIATPDSETMIRLAPKTRIRGMDVRAALAPGTTWSDVGINVTVGPEFRRNVVGTTSRAMNLGTHDAHIALRDETEGGRVLRYRFHASETIEEIKVTITVHGPGCPVTTRVLKLAPGQIESVDFSPWPRPER